MVDSTMMEYTSMEAAYLASMIDDSDMGDAIRSSIVRDLHSSATSLIVISGTSRIKRVPMVLKSCFMTIEVGFIPSNDLPEPDNWMPVLLYKINELTKK
jgi:hypothetical protein